MISQPASVRPTAPGSDCDTSSLIVPPAPKELSAPECQQPKIQLFTRGSMPECGAARWHSLLGWRYHLCMWYDPARTQPAQNMGTGLPCESPEPPASWPLLYRERAEGGVKTIKCRLSLLTCLSSTDSPFGL